MESESVMSHQINSDVQFWLDERNKSERRAIETYAKLKTERERSAKLEQERDEAVALIRSCGAYGWASPDNRKEASEWHGKAVAFLKRIGQWK